MALERRWCKHCARMTWHRREWTFPRSPGLALMALLALPLVRWYDPWDCTACDRRARRDLSEKRDRSDIVKLGGPADVRVPLSVLSRFPSAVPLSAVPLSASQPDFVCKSHWTAGKVGVRAHGAWGHELLERHL